MAFDGMPPLEGGAKGLCQRCRHTKPRTAFGLPRRKDKARDHICLECRAEMAAAPVRLGRPIGVKRQPNVCTGCGCHVYDRLQGEWICAPCRSKKHHDWKVRAGRASPKPERITPLDIPDAKWRALEEKNARDAWLYWVEVRAPQAWLDAYRSRHGARKIEMARECWRRAKHRKRLNAKGAIHRSLNVHGFERLYSQATRCAYCRTALTRKVRGKALPTDATIDHILPLSKGGAHSLSNIVVVCYRCNSSKGPKLVCDWAQTQTPQIAARALSIHRKRFGDPKQGVLC